MDNYLQQGIAAAKSGDKVRAFELLTRASQDTTTAEQAWLWLSSVVNTDEERLFCLGNVLRINPNNQHAKPAATMLRQKGIFPSAPVPPGTSAPASVPAPKPVTPAPAQSPAVQAQQDSLGWLGALAEAHQPVPAQVTPAGSRAEDEMAAHVKYAAMELSNNKPSAGVIKGLTERGIQPDVASRIVNDTQLLLKKARGEQHRKRMTRGAMWTIAGVLLTCGSYVFASELGGSYVLCYGAIIWGLIDFVVGLFGWLASQS